MPSLPHIPSRMERFLQKITILENDCWLWTGAKNKKGYGIFKGDMRTENAHVWIYQETYGSISPGKEIDHLCLNKTCVNPSHLEAVTHAENMQRYQRNRRKGLLSLPKEPYISVRESTYKTILEVLNTSPQKAFTTKEIAESIDATYWAIAKQLKRLAERGYILRASHGKYKAK
jgi:hypothetical protein